MNVGDNYNRPKVLLLLKEGSRRTRTIAVSKIGTTTKYLKLPRHLVIDDRSSKIHGYMLGKSDIIYSESIP